MKPAIVRAGIVLALLFALAPLASSADRPKANKLETFKGKVRRLADVLRESGVGLDADAAATWLALVGDGNIYPLVKDAGARPFFKDRALLDRPMQVTGTLVPGSRLLQVGAFHTVVKGELHEIYYWCDICSIRRSEKNICECCGGPMELREEKAKR